MAYIGATELSASSRPLALGEVATICERVSVELDTAAAIAGYLTPIPTTATQAFGQMALYNSWGAACRTLQIIFPGGGQSAEMPLAQDYCNDFRSVLDRLRMKQEILVGAPPDPSETSRELARSLSTGDPAATSGAQAQAQVGMKF
jgi:hypothetical protein